MVADLKVIGVTDQQLQPLFGSAQAYINMWSHVYRVPVQINSPNRATFTVGTAGSFVVTGTGNPAPTFNETGDLPAGVTFDGTSGIISGDAVIFFRWHLQLNHSGQ